ncbi:hypothetical protein [Propionivibrio dicarboxylicus]|nr:hypothetical protein [Propionivibrio dicarboxylicus]
MGANPRWRGRLAALRQCLKHWWARRSAACCGEPFRIGVLDR